MKVLHIVGDSKYGGGSVIILGLANLAKRLGWQTDVLTTEPIFQNVLRSSNIGVIDLDVIRRDLLLHKDFQGLFKLYLFLKKSEYSLIHTHTSKGGFIGRLAAYLAGISCIIHTVHGFAFHEQSGKLSLSVYSLFEKIAANWCDRVVTVSEFHRQWALKLGIGNDRKVVAIPNGISREQIIPKTDPRRVRTLLGLRDDELVLLSTGRLAPQKGLEFLIEAIPELGKILHQPLKVLFAGDGPLRDKLQNLVRRLKIGEKIMFLGFRRDIGDLLAASNIVVLPSLWEGLSISLLEAMAARKPIITTSIGSNREVTWNGEGALLVPPRDVPALIQAILKMARDPTLSAKIANKGGDIYSRLYTEDRMLFSYQKLYSEVLREKRVK